MCEYGLSNEYMRDLKEGKLNVILKAVLDDDTLSLEIRDSYVEVYYRGQALFRCTEKDEGYECLVLGAAADKRIKSIDEKSYDGISYNIPFMKQNIDLYLHENPDEEGEYCQLLERENNTGKGADDTDYYVADMNSEEYGVYAAAVKWMNTDSSREKGDSIALSFVEVKCRDKKPNDDSAMNSHIEKLSVLMQNKKVMNEIYSKVEKIFNQKAELGIIQGISGSIKINRRMKPEVILAVSTHRPDSANLISEIRELTTSFEYCNITQNANMKISKASYMGFGLYEENIYAVQEFINENQGMWGIHMEY